MIRTILPAAPGTYTLKFSRGGSDAAAPSGIVCRIDIGQVVAYRIDTLTMYTDPIQYDAGSLCFLTAEQYAFIMTSRPGECSVVTTDAESRLTAVYFPPGSGEQWVNDVPTFTSRDEGEQQDTYHNEHHYIVQVDPGKGLLASLPELHAHALMYARTEYAHPFDPSYVAPSEAA